MEKRKRGRPKKIVSQEDVSRETIDKDFETWKKFVKANEFVYKATLKTMGQTFQSTGNTIEEVIDNLKPGSWAKIAGVLTIEKGGVIREKIIAGRHLQSLFGKVSRMRKEIAMKYIKSIYNSL